MHVTEREGRGAMLAMLSWKDEKVYGWWMDKWKNEWRKDSSGSETNFTIQFLILVKMKGHGTAFNLPSFPHLICTRIILHSNYCQSLRILQRDYPSNMQFTDFSVRSSLLINLHIYYFQSVWYHNFFYIKKNVGNSNKS